MFEKRPQRHAGRVEVATYHGLKKSIGNLAREAWFNGQEADVYDRIDRLNALQRQARAVLASPQKLHTDEEAEVGTWVEDLETEKETLTRVIEELRDTAAREADANLPGYVASTFGDTRREVKANGEPRTQDWRVFVATRPKRFVAANETALFSTREMRVRAYDYIQVQASAVQDDQERANIIETFLNNVEIERRSQRDRAPRTKRQANIESAPRVDDRLLFL